MTKKSTGLNCHFDLKGFLFVGLTLGLAGGAHAQTWVNPIRFLTDPDSIQSSKNFLVTPFHNPGQSGRAMALAAPSLDSVVLSLFREHALDPRFQVKPQQVSGSGLGLVDGVNTGHYDFYLGGVRIYRYQIKASQMASLAPLVFGQMPIPSDMRAYSIDEWPNLDDAESLITQKVFDEYDIADPATVEKERCYYMYHGELLPVWRLVVRKEMLQYEGVADQNMVYAFFPKYFDVEGTATIYPNNALDKKTQDFALHNMTTSGHLENDKFKTALWSSSADTLALGAAEKFSFTPGTSQFEETSLFTNVNRHLEWLLANGFSGAGDKQIKVVAHAELSGDVNNALYQPDASGNNTVYIGDGDGVVLQNLATDADVISHEFSHHVIYKSITNIDNETSLVLHEGLADTLTYLRTGNACLGESICPRNSALCASSACLRTGLNDYSYGGASLPSEAHLKSQFISGFMWDLNIKDKIPVDVLSKTVINAITYLPAASSYEHLVIAMMYADKALNNSTYCMAIYARAAERGLYKLISGFGCGDQLNQTASNSATVTKYPGVLNSFPQSLPAGSASGSSSATSGATAGASSSHKSKGICGSLGGVDLAFNPVTMMLWLVPLLYPVISVVQRMRSRRRRSED